LPIPSEPIDIDSILFFKSSHGELLSRFRDFIETACIEIANIKDPIAKEDRKSNYYVKLMIKLKRYPM